ncbi:unnamed protein product, partial [Rotaria magnacalcarata]
MLLQEEALDILVEFLHVHGYTKVEGIPSETIRLLASIVLKENVFVYGKNIYQQVLGGAMGSSFTLTLANIFMWKWQKELVRRQDMTGEYYGRYIDDVFMTWNKSENALKQILENANTWHPNIKLEYKISKSLPFLDILLTNINGTLSTSVYHKPAAEPYVVPFISDHPRHVFENIVQTSLRRAIKYSSTFQLFNDERRYIESTFLYNGNPSSFIDKTFRKLFSDYISSRSFLPFLDNEAQFVQMHIELSGQPSRQQSQVEMRIATLTTDNEHLVEESDKKQEFAIQENKKPNEFQNKLIIHYTHEKRFNTQLPFEQMEQRLKELVDRERKYLSKRNNDKLIKFKDDIFEKQRLRLITVSITSPMNNQENEYINRLITIREKQAEIWKEQLMLEIQIHCKFLPQNFDQLENFISPTDYSPLNNNQKAIEIKNKHYKIIQEAKRLWLNYSLNIYEIKIQEYEQQYQNEFIKLESFFSNNNDKTILNNIKEHINNRINRLKKDIYDKIASFRRIILQNRQRSSSTK